MGRSQGQGLSLGSSRSPVLRRRRRCSRPRRRRSRCGGCSCRRCTGSRQWEVSSVVTWPSAVLWLVTWKPGAFCLPEKHWVLGEAGTSHSDSSSNTSNMMVLSILYVWWAIWALENSEPTWSLYTLADNVRTTNSIIGLREWTMKTSWFRGIKPSNTNEKVARSSHI